MFYCFATQLPKTFSLTRKKFFPNQGEKNEDVARRQRERFSCLARTYLVQTFSREFRGLLLVSGGFTTSKLPACQQQEGRGIEDYVDVGIVEFVQQIRGFVQRPSYYFVILHAHHTFAAKKNYLRNEDCKESFYCIVFSCISIGRCLGNNKHKSKKANLSLAGKLAFI